MDSSENLVSNLSGLLTRLENIEKNKLRQDERIQTWLETITTRDFRLIDSLMITFIANMREKDIPSIVLKILRLLNFYKRDRIKELINGNTMIPTALCEYIISNPPEVVCLNAYIMLSEVYVTYNFKEFVSKPLISALFNALGVAEEDEAFDSIILVLTGINFKYAEGEENLFCAVFNENENSRYLLEVMLRTLNSTDNKGSMYMILQAFYDLLKRSDECILYSSDVEAFINLSIHKLETTSDDILREHVLKVLFQLTRFDDYYKSRYKIDELTELLESYQTSDLVSEENRQKATKVLENLTSH